jgi:uncharacterized protein YbjT (DUF2867 family)
MFTQSYPTQQNPVEEEYGSTILVTGATGTVGREVVRQLIAAGERPRMLVHNGTDLLSSWGDRVERVRGDLNRPKTVEAALRGVDRVFLLTRQNSRQPDQERAVIHAAAQACVGRVVKLSVFRADDHSPLQIARQHRQAEKVLEESDLRYTIIRPVFFMQNLVGMVRGDAIYTAAEGGRVAMVDARDIAGVAVAALTRPGHEAKIYTLTGPEALNFDEVAEILSTHTARKIRHVRVSADDLRTSLARLGMAPWFAQDMDHLHSMLASGYEDLVTADVQAVTGKPPRTLAEFARDFADALGRQPVSK